ncbi:MAG: RNA-binding protein [Gammaproteobacteria bacterium]|nr:RNA-binding protein [Gammaproteobacteria bacterium]MDH5660317.1 RNA-binding protein [Gammaproteobacteria bacterium]
MKIALPTFKNIIKSIIIALILSLAGYFLFPFLNINELAQTAPDRLFAYSVLTGALIAGILVVTPLEFNLIGSKQVSVFVGNLAFKANANDLRELFEDYGDVQGVRVMTDRQTRRPKGFAFVEMDKKGAKAAIAELDGAEFFGRDIKVNYATRRKS